eukprot:gene41483-54996_t
MTTVRAATKTVTLDVLETSENDCSLPTDIIIDLSGINSRRGLRENNEMCTSGTMATTLIDLKNFDRVNNSSVSRDSSIGSVVVSQCTDSNVPSVLTSSIIDVSELDSWDTPSEDFGDSVVGGSALHNTGDPSSKNVGHVVESDDSYIDYSIVLSEESDSNRDDDDNDYEISEYDGSMRNHGAGILDNAKEGDEDIRSIDDIESTARVRSPARSTYLAMITGG